MKMRDRDGAAQAKRVAVIGLSLLLAGCCSNVTADPRGGGLAGGVCGTVGGGYERRVALLEGEAGSLEDDNRRIGDRLASARATVGDLDRVIAGQRSRLAQAEMRLAALKAKAAAAHGADTEYEMSLRRQIDRLIAVTEQQDRIVRAIEGGVKGARDEGVINRARARADVVPVDALLGRIDALEAKL